MRGVCPGQHSTCVAAELMSCSDPRGGCALSADVKNLWSPVTRLLLRFYHINQSNHGCRSCCAKREWAKYFNEQRNKPETNGPKYRALFLSLKQLVLVRRTHQRIPGSGMKNVHVRPHLSVTGLEWWQFYTDKWLGTDGTVPRGKIHMTATPYHPD